jgi:hypothetical protein
MDRTPRSREGTDIDVGSRREGIYEASVLLLIHIVNEETNHRSREDLPPSQTLMMSSKTS